MQRSSNCSIGVNVDFYWRETLSMDRQDHIDAAVQAVYEALDGPDRRWSPFSTASVKGDIRARIIMATRGELIPVDHVKSLRNGVGDLFEIRWQGLAVANATPTGLKYESALARLIHIEPTQVSVGAIGIRAFEKLPSEEGKQIQEEQIDLAERYALECAREQWGVPIGELRH